MDMDMDEDVPGHWEAIGSPVAASASAREGEKGKKKSRSLPDGMPRGPERKGGLSGDLVDGDCYLSGESESKRSFRALEKLMGPVDRDDRGQGDSDGSDSVFRNEAGAAPPALTPRNNRDSDEGDHRGGSGDVGLPSSRGADRGTTKPRGPSTPRRRMRSRRRLHFWSCAKAALCATGVYHLVVENLANSKWLVDPLEPGGDVGDGPSHQTALADPFSSADDAAAVPRSLQLQEGHTTGGTITPEERALRLRVERRAERREEASRERERRVRDLAQEREHRVRERQDRLRMLRVERDRRIHEARIRELERQVTRMQREVDAGEGGAPQETGEGPDGRALGERAEISRLVTEARTLYQEKLLTGPARDGGRVLTTHQETPPIEYFLHSDLLFDSDY